MDWDRPEFTLLDHTADLGIIIGGPDLKSLFKTAASAMMHIMVNIEPVKRIETAKLSVSGEDLADLLVRWLGEIHYLFAGENRIVTNTQINFLTPSHLDALLQMVPFDPDRHRVLCEIKAVTYHQIELTKKAGTWEARIVFDL